MLTNQLLKFTKEAKQMKKFVVKTTKEFTYNEKGFIIKEVVTEESYEQEMYTGGGTIKTGTITADDIKVDTLKKVTGVTTTPYTTSYEDKADTTTVVHNVTLNTAKTITEIANEVRAILDKDLKLSPNKFSKF
jgi:hypothetical protein